MPISCIAIDDDPGSLESLKEYVTKLPDLELVNIFTEPLKALTEISAAKPVDIIFMDVEMPAISGIELATLLRQKTKHLIFTTAHPKYAIDAFKVEADAYLLKPYSILHFAKTISNLYPPGSYKQLPFSMFDEHFFYIPLQNNEGDIVRLDIIDLVALEELEHAIQFKTIKNSFQSSKINFSNVLDMLKNHPAFIQINPSTVISKQHIKSVLNDQVVLTEGLLYIISKEFRKSFSDFIENNLSKGNKLN